MILLHVHCICEPYHRPSPAFDDAIEFFLDVGAVRPDSASASGYRTTKLGAAWVERLLNTPAPITA